MHLYLTHHGPIIICDCLLVGPTTNTYTDVIVSLGSLDGPFWNTGPGGKSKGIPSIVYNQNKLCGDNTEQSVL